MKLIVGLGNPGARYKNSRHNIGIHVVKDLAREFRVKLSSDRDTRSKRAQVRFKGLEFILAHPLLFMNLSGESVSLLLKKYKITMNNFLVVHDDLDLNLGTIRIRPKGGSAGHKGLRSIIEALGSNEFARLRIGIGRTQNKQEIKDFVLGGFTKDQQGVIKETLRQAAECSRSWLFDGVIKAMERFN